jgi:acetoacetyl-CoA synthetase
MLNQQSVWFGWIKHGAFANLGFNRIWGSSMSVALWQPSVSRVESANLSRFIRFMAERCGRDMLGYEDLYNDSINHPADFWRGVWEFCGIRATGELDPVVVDFARMPGAVWFPEVRLNFAQNLLRFKDDKPALLFRDESGFAAEVSFAQLHEQVSQCAAGMRALGVVAGDRVAGFMPNVPETVIAMLAASSLGAIWSSCSPDFGAGGVVDRFGQIEPKILFAAAAYIYGGKRHDCLAKLAQIMPRLPSVQCLVIVPFQNDTVATTSLPNATTWEAFCAHPKAPLQFESLPFNHPLYIMFSSGTTGVPKCIVHSAGGTLIQHLKELVLHTDLKREDRIFYYTTCGWMMWNWLVSSLAVGATVVLYDGSPSHPSPNVLWDLVEELNVTVFGTSAKWISASEKAGLKPKETHKCI